jgi:ketosteroid isomerase-like protein
MIPGYQFIERNAMIRFENPILLFILFATACTAPGSRDDISDEIQMIRDADQALLMAEKQRDLDAVMEYIAEGAIYHPPNAPPVVGREAIRDFYLEWFKIPYLGIYRDSDSIVIAFSGELACLIGNSHIDIKTETGRERLEGKYITVWRKFEGKWFCVAVSWSGND